MYACTLQGQPWCFTKTSESDPPATCQNDNFPRNDCGQWAIKCVHIWIILWICLLCRLCWSHSAAVHRQRLLLASAGRELLWTIPTLLLIDFCRVSHGASPRPVNPTLQLHARMITSRGMIVVSEPLSVFTYGLFCEFAFCAGFVGVTQQQCIDKGCCWHPQDVSCCELFPLYYL